jgi:hypothetical protein
LSQTCTRRSQTLTLQRKCQRFRSQRLFGWWASRPKVEVVRVDSSADSLDVLLFLHHFVLIVAVTGNKEADNQEQGEWVT